MTKRNWKQVTLLSKVAPLRNFVKINNKFSFDEYVKSICYEANSKLRALVRNTPDMDIGKRRL